MDGRREVSLFLVECLLGLITKVVEHFKSKITYIFDLMMDNMMLGPLMGQIVQEPCSKGRK